MRRFVIVGQKALASPDFSLLDLPGTSGRLDVLVRCLRSSLLVSHGLRRDTVVYLVLLGGPRAPRSLRVSAETARFLRPDERSLATLLQKSLAAPAEGPGFVEVKPGVAVAEGGLESVLEDLGPGSLFLLEQGAPDLRTTPLSDPDLTFFLGDHLGLDDASLARIRGAGARGLGLGPVTIHAEDAIALVHNELDRRPP